MPIVLLAQYAVTETSLGKKRQLEEHYPPSHWSNQVGLKYFL
tara:strand:- start:138 stop:263 length:126 start_codon:yes stop_codon:yes gene_type:complete